MDMRNFFARKEPLVVRKADDAVTWQQLIVRSGTTALIPYNRMARPGWSITHAAHGKVKLLGVAGPGQLKVERLNSHEQIIVDTADCGEPISAPIKVTGPKPTIDEWICEVWTPSVINNALKRAVGRSNAAGKKPVGATDATDEELPASPAMGTSAPRRRGRPPGSLDKVQRVRVHTSLNITWDYGGKQGPPGPQFASIGDAVRHNSFATPAYIIQQPTPSSLALRLGDGDDATIMNVNAIDVQAVVQGITTKASSSGVQKPRSKDLGPRKKRGRCTAPSKEAQQQPSPLVVVVKKALAKETHKRRQREANAEARGRPLKAAREQKNRKWDQVYKSQAISLFNSKFSVGNDYAGCRNELLKLPGFQGVESGHIRSWVLGEARHAAQEPNHLGLIVTAKGKKPSLPALMYNELVAQLQKLAKVVHTTPQPHPCPTPQYTNPSPFYSSPLYSVPPHFTALLLISGCASLHRSRLSP